MRTATEEVALSDTSRSFRRASNNEYAFRVPTPPRIIIPPPAVNSQETPTGLHVTSISTLDGRGPNLNFLARINGGELTTQNAGLEWAYEKRREAQMVTPYIFLGALPAFRLVVVANRSSQARTARLRTETSSPRPTSPCCLPSSRPACP